MTAYVVDLVDSIQVGSATNAPYHWNFCEVVEADDVVAIGLGGSIADTINVSDALVLDQFLQLGDVIQISDSVVYSVTTNELLVDVVRVSDAASVAVVQDFADVADVGDASDIVRAVDLVDSTTVGEALTHKAIVVNDYADKAGAGEGLGNGKVFDGAEVVNVSDAIFATKFVTYDLADTIQVAHANSQSAGVDRDTVFDTVQVSDATTQYLVTSVLLADVVNVSDALTAPDSGAAAWVCNTETGAVSKFGNYSFNSMAQLGNNIVMAGPDGLYVMGGDLDVAEAIDARLETGFMELGSTAHTRTENVYIGYEGGKMGLGVETYGEGLGGNRTYKAELRPGAAPVTTRVVMPKGLVSRNWRFTFSNVDGSYFNVSKIEVSVADTKRRV